MSKAIQHLLRQMQRDGRLAYLIGPGSQTFDLLTQEAAQVAGREVGDFRREFESTLTVERWMSPSDIADQISGALEAHQRQGPLATGSVSHRRSADDNDGPAAGMSTWPLP